MAHPRDVPRADTIDSTDFSELIEFDYAYFSVDISAAVGRPDRIFKSAFIYMIREIREIRSL